jgi:hypothetical protein
MFRLLAFFPRTLIWAEAVNVSEFIHLYEVRFIETRQKH